MVLVVWPLQANGTLCIRFVSHSLPLFLVVSLISPCGPLIWRAPPCHQQEQQQEQPCGWVCVIDVCQCQVWVAVEHVCVVPSDVWACCRGFDLSLPLSHVCLLPSLCTCCSPLPNCFVGTGSHPSPLALAVCYCCCWCCVEWLWVDHTYKMHLSRIRVHCFLWSTRRCTMQRSCSTHK